MRMSRAPNPDCFGFSTSFASRIAPAHVPNVGFTRTNCFSFSNPASPSSFRNVPDSPPGITRPSISSSCSGFLTSTTSAPSSSSRLRWASKSPWSARTPIFIYVRLLRTPPFVGRLDAILLDVLTKLDSERSHMGVVFNDATLVGVKAFLKKLVSNQGHIGLVQQANYVVTQFFPNLAEPVASVGRLSSPEIVGIEEFVGSSKIEEQAGSELLCNLEELIVGDSFALCGMDLVHRIEHRLECFQPVFVRRFVGNDREKLHPRIAGVTSSRQTRRRFFLSHATLGFLWTPAEKS